MNLDIKNMVRPEILALKPYSVSPIHPQENLRLHANENRFCDGVNSRYPDIEQINLTRRLGQYYQINPENLLISRGSSDGIDILCRTFLHPGLDSILCFSPGFEMYKMLAHIQGASVFEFPLTDQFEIDFPALNKTLKQNTKIKLVFFCTPHNPSGNIIDPESLLAFTKQHFDRLIIIDEAYIEFSECESLISKIADYPNLIILRTLSKALGLAGCRIGCLMANKEIIKYAKKTLPPYAVSTPSIHAVLKALTPAGIVRIKNNISEIIKARNALKNKLEKHDQVIDILPSNANFLLVRFKNAEQIFYQLIQAGIYVRDLRNSIKNGLRITIGSSSDHAILLNALRIKTPLFTDRIAKLERTTKETSIYTEVNLDKEDPIQISTGIGFFDHMLELVSKHSSISINIFTKGDLHIDPHHTIEDTMLALGKALRQALGDKHGIHRYGFSLPMDEAKAEVLLDLSGRAFCQMEGYFTASMLGQFPTEMIFHAFQSLSLSLNASIHVKFKGKNDHHKAESAFKALAYCLKMACKKQGNTLPSTKGVL